MNDSPKLILESKGIFFTSNVPATSISTVSSPYVCFLCMHNIFSAKSATKHSQSYRHLEHMNIFNQYFKIIPPANLTEKTSLICKLCNSKLAWGNAFEHAQTHDLILWFKPEDMHRTFFRHFISEHENKIYKCNLCNYIYGHWFHAMKHITDDNHIKTWKTTSAPSANYALYENTMQQFEILVNNRIFIGESEHYHCHMCNLGFDNISQSQNHWEGVEHKNITFRFFREISLFKMEIPESLEWIKMSNYMVVMKDKIYCKICDIYMTDINEVDAHIKDHEPEYAGVIRKDSGHQLELEDFDPDNHSHGPSVPLTECALVVPKHLKWIISAHKVVVKPDYLFCVICHKILNNNSAVVGHLVKHLKPSWQETNSLVLRKVLAKDCKATTEQAEMSGSIGVAGVAEQGASSSGTVKRTALSPQIYEQKKMQKMDHSGLEPPFQSCNQINPQPANNPPSHNPPPLLSNLSNPGPSGISRFEPNFTNPNYPAAMVITPRNGGSGILGNHPPLLPAFSNKNSRNPVKNKNARPNLINLMKSIPSLMSKPINTVLLNNSPGSSSLPNGTAPLINHSVNNQNNPPVNNQVHKNPINRLSNSLPSNKPTFVKESYPKLNPQFVSNNSLVNKQIMVKLHKASYLFFAKNMIYDMAPEKKRRIILSSQLSFFVKYTSDYFLYCVVCEKSIPYNLQSVYEHWCSSEHNEYLWKMEEDHKQFSNYPTQFSCLALSKEFMIESQKPGVSSDSKLKEFTCCACDVTVQDNDSLLGQHFRSENHQNNVQRFRRHSEKMCKDLFPLVESSWYNIEKYSCWPCKKILTNEVPYADHLDSRTHMNIIQAMTLAEKESYTFDSCTVCGILWFGDRDEYPKHCYKDAIHKELTRSIEDRVDYLPEEAGNLCSSVEDHIAGLVYEADKLLQDRGRESELIRSLELAVRRKFPEAKAHPFGSRVTGLGFTTSDIDIFLDCGKNFHFIHFFYSYSEGTF